MHTSQKACLLQLTTSKSYGSRESQLMQQGRLSSKTSLLIQATGCRTACRAPPSLLPACTQHRLFQFSAPLSRIEHCSCLVSAALTCPEDGTKSCRSARAAGWGTASTWTSPLPSTRASRPSLHGDKGAWFQQLEHVPQGAPGHMPHRVKQSSAFVP